MMQDTFHRPLMDLRISVTDRCNFRCTYCMPAEIFGESYRFLPRSEVLTFEEITRLTHLFVQQGVTKLRLTGGEPLVRQSLATLVAMLATIEGVQDLTLTTNGSLLEGQAAALKEAGLNRVTVSLDCLDDDIFGKMNGRQIPVARVLAGIQKATEVGLTPIKINCVVQRGVNDHTIADLARYFQGTGCIVRFIEYMDVGNINGWNMDDVVPATEIVERINAAIPLEPIDRNYRGEVATRYRYLDNSGEIGVISSVTQPFCGDCTRARLSTDGKLLTCLFADDGLSLRDPLRAGATDAELTALIRRIWSGRTDRYSEIRTLLTPEQRLGRRKVEMYQIGG